MVIDGDGHCNEPRDLFDRYLEKEFRERGPKVVDASGTRWMIEGKFLPRPVGTWGHGSSSGYFGTNMSKKGMATTTQSLDDVPGRLKDLDTEGIDVQVVYPNIMAMVSHLDDGDLAAAMCRAYNNYAAEKSKSILESRFGPLQEKDHRAADALSRTRGMKKPALLMHGTADRTVPIAHGKQLAESIGETATFFPVEGGDHHLRNVDRRFVIETILAWLNDQDSHSQ